MADMRCPHCGHDFRAGGSACPKCGHLLNGEVLPAAGNLASGKPSPELMEWARANFNEEEFLAGLREVEADGGLELKDFIKELEQEAGLND